MQILPFWLLIYLLASFYYLRDPKMVEREREREREREEVPYLPGRKSEEKKITGHTVMGSFSPINVTTPP
jgi:hypothetical protein